MAYDKVVDSSVLNANLTSVANAIRTKGGATGNLVFPTGFVDAISAIQTGTVSMEVHEITIASTLGNGTNSMPNILTSNAFVKAHRSKDTFAVLMYPKSPTSATEAYMSHSLYHGNVNLATTNLPRYGFAYTGSSASAMGFVGISSKLDATGYNVSFRTTTGGNLSIYVASNRKLPAGDYTLVMMNWEGM